MSRRRKHGWSYPRIPEYVAWTSMKQRCCNRNARGYSRYGGRGIKVCSRWLLSFENFLADMGRRPSPQHSIDRIDNDGNYEPGNCRWATQKQQSANTSRTVKLSLNGETRCLKHWAVGIGVSEKTLHRRISHYGLNPREALVKRIFAKNARLLTLEGTTRTVAAWTRVTGLSSLCIDYRLKKGWSVEQALLTPRATHTRRNGQGLMFDPRRIKA